MKQESLQQLCLQHLCSLGENPKQPCKGDRFGPLSSKRTSNTYIWNPMNAWTYYTSSSKDSARHVDFPELPSVSQMSQRVLTVPLQLDSSFLVTLEVMVALTCVTRHSLCTHHRSASYRRKVSFQTLGAAPTGSEHNMKDLRDD